MSIDCLNIRASDHSALKVGLVDCMRFLCVYTISDHEKIFKYKLWYSNKNNSVISTINLLPVFVKIFLLNMQNTTVCSNRIFNDNTLLYVNNIYLNYNSL